MLSSNTNIELLVDYDGASLGAYSEEGTSLTCALSEEPLVDIDYEIHDYNLHFNFGLSNHSEEHKQIKVIIQQTDKKPIPDAIWSSTSPSNCFLESKVEVTKCPAGYAFTVDLPPMSKRYFSNTMWKPLKNITLKFDEYVKSNYIHKLNYGKSVLGHDLNAFTLYSKRNEKLPLICISSGIHPAEGDTISTVAITEWLLNEGNHHNSAFDFMIIPVLNPDGFISGKNGCNHNGVNFFWDFQKYNIQACPEAHYLWNLFQTSPPNIYIDFHSYTTQGQSKQFGPYLKNPVLYTSKNTRHISLELSKELEKIPNSRSQILLSPASLPYNMTKEFNTITFAKYHLHQGYGINHMRDLSVEVIEKIIKSSYGCDFTTQILQPYGPLKRTFNEIIKQTLYVQRYYLPKKLKRLLEKH
tara:strand:+ start:705 stop:1940 length:1236 start_codon:yes stop_codon:yes gene_type:complete